MLPVNQSLGLTFYCSGIPLERQPSGSHAPEQSPRRPPARLGRAGLARPVGRRLQDHRRRHHRLARPFSDPTAPHTEADWRQMPRSGGPLPRQYRRCQGRHGLCPGAARHRPARPGGRRAAAGLDPQSQQHEAARRLWPRAGRRRAIPEALDALSRAHTPDNPDWRILNAQGAVLDQMGRHAEAQRHYSAALKICRTTRSQR